MRKNNLKRRIGSSHIQVIVKNLPSTSSPSLSELHVKLEQPTPLASPRPKLKPLIEFLRELVGLISASAGIFAVFLYLAGRSFANGYFTEMNIPIYHVSFSLWEYGEVAWRPLIIYPTIMLGVTGLIWGTLYVLKDRIVYHYTHIHRSKNNQSVSPDSVQHQANIGEQAKLWFLLLGIAILTLLFAYGLENSLKYVENSGRLTANEILLKGAPRVELVSSNSIAFDENSDLGARLDEQNYYVYSGFHLLTFNNGKYFLFKNIDPVTCRPAKVYIVEPEQSIHVNLLPAISLSDQCKKRENVLEVLPATKFPTP